MFQKGFGGRRKGSKNKKTLRRLEEQRLQREAMQEARIRLAQAQLASQEEIEMAASRMHTMSPLEVMLTGMHLKLGRGDIGGAIKIAEAAAPYTSPRLNATDVRVQHSVAGKSDVEVAAEIEALRMKIERSRSAPVLLEAAVTENDSVITDRLENATSTESMS